VFGHCMSPRDQNIPFQHSIECSGPKIALLCPEQCPILCHGGTTSNNSSILFQSIINQCTNESF
jgi:hypothetical protein